MKKSLNILEVNNLDLAGRRFNGYDLIDYAQNHTSHNIYQFTKLKQSNNQNVYNYFDADTAAIEYKLNLQEEKELSVQGCLSLTTPYLYNSDIYKKADVIHYHMIHNTKLNLFSLIESSYKKPTIISIHDFWLLTGRCVQPYNCKKWLTGCKNCEYLNNYFILPKDNANYLWELKKEVLNSIDADILVASQYIYDCVKSSPMFKGKNIHYIPFGLDLDKFKDYNKKEKFRKKLGISKDNIVLFLRSQEYFKGIEYIRKALKGLKTNKKITILTCCEKGLLDSLKDKYQIIEMGYINSDDDMIECYQACDIFLMPSMGETFGMMAVEAMACERPVIVFDNTALPSITFAPECGVLVEDRNAKKLMQAIKWLIEDDDERKRRGKLCRQKAEENYDAKRYNKDMIRLYEEVAMRPKPSIIPLKSSNTNIEDINAKLYFVTKNIFGFIPKEFKRLGLKEKKVIAEINYADVNIQEFIINYNNALYNYTINVNNKNQNIIIKKAKTFSYLYRTDKKKLKEVIQQKLGGKNGRN